MQSFKPLALILPLAALLLAAGPSAAQEFQLEDAASPAGLALDQLKPKLIKFNDRPSEEQIDLRTRHLRFDIGLLADRLVGTIDWLAAQPATRTLPVGLFGASTGGGAALVAAEIGRAHV